MSGIGPSIEDTKNQYEIVPTLEAVLAVVERQPQKQTSAALGAYVYKAVWESRR